ncbi:hypothetical protein QI193_02855 [Staphylococcus saprophyticus]|nr:hypothetical protein [Staphylococcus saprophyticus]
MPLAVKSYRAKKIPFKMAVIENETTFKQVAIKTNSAYQTIIQIAAGTHNTSELRAKAIAELLGKNVDDLFTEVK